MLDQIKSLFGLNPKDDNSAPIVIDKNLAAAALMVHIIVADGKITADEDQRLRSVLRDHYAMSDEDAQLLETTARSAQSQSIDLYSFTSVLKSEMADEDRLGLIEDLWEMVYADGELHEFEDNLVWRIAELIGIQSRERMVLKQRVLSRLNAK